MLKTQKAKQNKNNLKQRNLCRKPDRCTHCQGSRGKGPEKQVSSLLTPACLWRACPVRLSVTTLAFWLPQEGCESDPSSQLSDLNITLIRGNKNSVLTTFSADTCPKSRMRRKHVSCTLTEFSDGNRIEKSEIFTKAKMTSSSSWSKIT